MTLDFDEIFQQAFADPKNGNLQETTEVYQKASIQNRFFQASFTCWG
ncbi:MAG: hypothetical protein U9R02_14905 [Thermodesulfobacteriota bacterium]|nr:hypothetical protein [Thermodesulfobacteriota bacterium]